MKIQAFMPVELSEAEKYLLALYDLLGEGLSQSMIRTAITEQCARERERCIKIAEGEMREAANLTDKEFSDGYSFAAQTIIGKIRSGL
jgi:hypothetical protein